MLGYAGHNLFASIVAYVGGHWIDRSGPRLAFATGAAVYVASYVLSCSAGSNQLMSGQGSWPYLDTRCPHCSYCEAFTPTLVDASGLWL